MSPFSRQRGVTIIVTMKLKAGNYMISCRELAPQKPSSPGSNHHALASTDSYRPSVLCIHVIEDHQFLSPQSGIKTMIRGHHWSKSTLFCITASLLPK